MQSEEPKDDWVIDKDRMDEATLFPVAAQHRHSESFTGVQIISQPIFRPNRPVHHVLPLSLSAPKDADLEEEEPPLISRWSDSEHQAPTPTPPINKPKKSLVPKIKFKGIPNPFRSKPVRVEHVPPRQGFQLDDYDVRTESIVTRQRMHDEESDRKSVGSSVMRDMDEDRQERLTLISTEERRRNEVFLISKTGENFTLSSKTAASQSVVTSEQATTSIGMDIISPTASTLTHSWRASGSTQVS